MIILVETIKTPDDFESAIELAMQITLDRHIETGFLYEPISHKILTPIYIGNKSGVDLDRVSMKEKRDLGDWGSFHTHTEEENYTDCNFSEHDIVTALNYKEWEVMVGCPSKNEIVIGNLMDYDLDEEEEMFPDDDEIDKELAQQILQDNEIFIKRKWKKD